MIYKVLKPSGKDAEERETLTSRKRPRVSSGDEKPRARLSSDPPSSLRAFSYYGRTMDDPQLKLKLLELSPETATQETSAGVHEFVKHVTSIVREQKNSGTDEDATSDKKHFVTREEKNKNCERSTRGDEASRKSLLKITRTQQMDSRKEFGECKSKSCPERKSDKVLRRACERREDQDLEMDTPEEKRRKSEEKKSAESGKTGVGKTQSEVGPENKKRSRRSEIPLLKSRQNLEKKNEIVRLLMERSLKKNLSAKSVDFCRKSEPHSECTLSAASETEVENFLKESCASSQQVDIGKCSDLKSATRQLPEPSIRQNKCVKSANTPSSLEICQCNARTVKACKVKTLDLEKVRTSSFTVLQAENNNFSRLESFHRQNISAKETARAEIALKASKITIKASKTSFTSVNSKKSCPTSAGRKRSKSITKKCKKNKKDSQENKKCVKMSETPCTDMYKEIIATGKVDCLISKRMKGENENKKAKSEDRSPSCCTAESRDRAISKMISKASLKDKECSKRNKVEQSSEKTPKLNPVPVSNKSDVASAVSSKSSLENTSKAAVVEITPKDAEVSQTSILEEISNEEVKLSARELASLVVTGTALNFDEIEDSGKQPEVDKVKLEIKINVPSEEDVTDSEALECDSSGDVSGASLEWLIKRQNNEKQVHENDRIVVDKLRSWDLLPEEFKRSEWQPRETPLQGAYRSFPTLRRPSNLITSDNKPDTKVRSGLTRSSNRDEKMFDDPTALKLRRRNSEPYSFRGFIWKRADITSQKSLKPSVSSMASSLRHLNTDEMDDFIFWEAVPQKLTSCWEMSLYHFKRPWSVLSCSVFKDNRKSNTPGLILDTLRSGGVSNMRRPILYQNDRVNRHKGNIFDVEPSISQKNIDIRNWLAALNFTTPISNASDVSEGSVSTSPVSDIQKEASFRRRNVAPQFRLPNKVSEKKKYLGEKHKKFDKWSISDVDDLKELIRRESGSYVTKEQFILSELSNLRSAMVTNACAYSALPEKSGLTETGDQSADRKARPVKSVETSCQSELLQEAREKTKLNECLDFGSGPTVGTFKRVAIDVPPDINVWKYLFLFTLMFIILHYSLKSSSVICS